MAIIYKLALEKNIEIPKRLGYFFEKTSSIQNATDRASKIEELIEEEFKTKIFPEKISKNYEIGYIAFILLSLLYEDITLNLLQQFETYARYFWINLKKKEIEDVAFKIIDGKYMLKKPATTENNILSFNEKIVKEFSKEKIADTLELLSDIGKLYMAVIEELGIEVREKIENFDKTLKKTELKEITQRHEPKRKSIKDKSMIDKEIKSKTDVSLAQNLSVIIKVALAASALFGTVYLVVNIHNCYKSLPPVLNDDVISKLVHCLKKILPF